MRVLVIGSGAREHALVKSLAADPSVAAIFCAPGNAGIAADAHVRPVDAASAEAVVGVAQEVSADLVVIGPEVPLVLGVADAVRAAGIACFGPSASAARIEGSKAFAKDVMAAAGVRTARAESVDSPADLDAALDRFGPTWVVKDDGLAAGKGVVVTADRAEARAHAIAVLDAGHPVLLESFLSGPEVSLFCLVDGETVVPLLPAQDFKRVGDGDAGANTGGMGAYAPLPWLPESMARRIVDEAVAPVAREMAARGCPYSGLLYAGLAIDADGPAVVEFNCRFGDPETQAILPLLRTPLGGLLAATAAGTLAEHEAPQWREGAGVVVVLAAQNYPGTPRKGDAIIGAEGAGDTGSADGSSGSGGSAVLHAGTSRSDDGTLVSAGGRVLGVVGTGADLAEARACAYARLAGISLPGSHHRSDIGLAAEQGLVGI